MNNVMVDIETLGTGPDTVVLSVALVRFNDCAEAEFLHIKFNSQEINQQVEKGRKISPDTVMWWLQQGKDAQAAITETYNTDFKRGMYAALSQISKFMQPGDIIWANPPSFDVATLDNLMAQFDLPAFAPEHWNVRDLRTIKKTFGSAPKRPDVVAHDALWDCLQQIDDLRFGLKKAGMMRSLA